MLKTGDKLHGFTVTRIRENDELGGQLVEMEYERTRTPLCWVDNGDENKLFCISFKTLPEDSTGVFHILEHSTLCGSRKYPVREPFVDLAKSSMNTYLNAMTGPDRTFYPVASRNEKDYLNLASVYLDAVFAPRLTEDANIFYQEGWHAEEAEDGSLIYKGVVFNEMKGNVNDPDHVIDQKLGRMIHGDSPYAQSSGGEPECIPGLTLEKFRETYTRFYHPSNAIVVLDGDVPLEETLTLLEEYFSRYELRTDFPESPAVIPHAESATVEFEPASPDDLTDQGRMVIGSFAGSCHDRPRIDALAIICSVLAGSNEAPLTRAVLDSGLAKDLSLSPSAEGPENVLTLELYDVKDGAQEELLALLWKSLNDILEKGLPREDIEAVLTQMEIHVREAREPKGIGHMFCITDALAFGEDPLEYITFNGVFGELRKMLEEDGFNTIAREALLNTDNLLMLTAIPVNNLSEAGAAREKEALEKLRASMTGEELQALRERNAALTAWQQTPDTPEQIATLPTLSLSDVKINTKVTLTEEHEEAGVTVWHHPLNCSGINYFRLYFSISDFKLEDVPPLRLLNSFFGRLGTENHDAHSLELAQKRVLGKLSLRVCPESIDKDMGVCSPKLIVSFSALDVNVEQAFDLVREILFTTRFDDRQRIREEVQQRNEILREHVLNSGMEIANACSRSHIDAGDALMEGITGYTGMCYLEELDRHFDEKFPEVVAAMERLRDTVFCRARLIASQTSEKYHSMEKLLSALPQGEPVAPEAAYVSPLPRRMGIRLPARVSYLSHSALVPNENHGYKVGDTILTMDCLWNRIRVQGGAYGCAHRSYYGGMMTAYTYRDPTPARSLKVLEGMADYLEQFVQSGEKLDKYIISTLGEVDPITSPRQKGAKADALLFSGKPQDFEVKMQEEILATTPEDLLAMAADLRKQSSNEGLCVIGPDAALREAEGLTVFDF